MIIKSMKCILVAVFSLCIMFFSNPLMAQEPPAEEGRAAEEKFDPAKEIMGHIRDAYEFHFFTLGDFHATIHLPVLLYSPQRSFIYQ